MLLKKTNIIIFSLIILTLFTSAYAETYIVRGDSALATTISSTGDPAMIYPFSEGQFAYTKYFSGINAIKLITWTGSYYSPIFQLPANATLEEISWTEGVPYQKELLNSKANENVLGGINMGNNVLLMHMNEASGQINDYSGSGNDGTTKGGINYNVSGRFDKALNFDGVDDYILTAKDDNNIDCSPNSRTYCAWVNVPSDISGGAGSIRTIMSKSPLRGDKPRFYFYILKSTGLPAFTIEGFLTGMINTATGTTDLRGKGWSLVCFVRDRTSDKLRIYVNGIEEGNVNDVDYDAHNNGALIIGDIENYTGISFKGKIDEVSIFTRTLSAQEIEDMYKRGIMELDIKIKSCTSHNCIGDPNIDIPNKSPQDLTNITTKNYFMSRFYFTTETLSFFPELHNITLTVSIKDTKPNLNIYPLRVDEDTQIREPTINLWNMAYDTHTATDKLIFKIESQSNGILDCSLKQNKYIECDPDLNAYGQKTIEISVTDESNNTVQGNMTITVNPMNDLPEITNLPVNLNAKEGEEINFNNVEAQDVEDGNALRYYIFNNIKNARIINNGNFYWTPGYDDQGSHDFEIRVMDNAGGSGKGFIHIDVEDALGPDLKIEQVDVMDLPDEKIFSFFVKNAGNKEINDFEYKVEDGLGKEYTEIASMPQPLGIDEEMMINYKVSYKSYSKGTSGFAKIILDPDDKIREENENNNEVTGISILV